MTRIAILLAALAACGTSDRAAPAPAPAPARRPALEHASQADLAREIADADLAGAWSELVQRWQGQTVRWTVTRQRALCRTAGDCYVAAFPIQRPARQGWMPELRFASGEFEALGRLCGDRAQCEVTIDATLSKLDVSSELAAGVQLSNVRIVLPAAQTAQR
jgi:hypothetical protein